MSEDVGAKNVWYTLLSISFIAIGKKRFYLAPTWLSTRLCLELPPDFFCQTSFWQNDLVLLVDIES